MENLYRILKVESTASEDEINKAINHNLRIWSNRTNAPSLEHRQEAERMVKLLQEAETILLNVSKRTEYDRQLATEATRPVEQPVIEESHQGDDQDLLEKGRTLLHLGKIADALFILTQAVQQHEDDAETWALRGQANLEWGEIGDAISDFSQAIMLRPNVALYYFELGNAYESMEQWDDALRQYQRAAQIEPQTFMYQAAIGGLLTSLGRYQDSIHILEQCVQADSQNDVYQSFLARAYVASTNECLMFVPPESSFPGGNYATTKQQLQQAIAMTEKAASLRFNDGELTTTIVQAKMDFQRMLCRKFQGSWFVVGIAMAFGLLFMFFQIWEIAAYFFVCSGLYVASCMTPQYAINRMLINGKGGTLTNFIMSLWRGGTMPGWLVGIAILIIVVMLPIVVAWNFVRNYVLVN